MNKEFLIRLSKRVEGGVENWCETFPTVEEAQARIDEVNVEGSNITADPIIDDISEKTE